jgi:hypothetical protein
MINPFLTCPPVGALDRLAGNLLAAGERGPAPDFESTAVDDDLDQLER